MATAAPTSPPFADSQSLASRLVSARWLVIGALSLVAPVIAVVQLGRIHPDELFQTLEPAFWRVHGYGILSWEWQPQGAIRNWITPSVFAALLWLSDALGVTNPRVYRAICELPVWLLHGWMLVAAYRYAERRVGPERALLAPLLISLYAVTLTFGGRTMSETFSAALLVIGFEALDRNDPAAAPRSGLVAGLALGFAVVTRYGSAVMVIAALGFLVARRDWRKLFFTVLAGLGVLGLLAAVDNATWGSPLSSLFAYLRFNVTSGAAAAQFGEAPWHTYLPVMAGALPLWFWPGLLGTLWLQRPKLPLALVAAVAYLAVISGTAHKEPRFLYPALLFLLFAAAPGLVAFAAKLPKPAFTYAALAFAVATTFFPPSVSDDLKVQRPEQFQAIVAATREGTGLLIVNDGMWGSGGYFYIGKVIPWTMADVPEDPRFQGAIADARVNRVITYNDHLLENILAGGFVLQEQRGATTVLIRKPKQ